MTSKKRNKAVKKNPSSRKRYAGTWEILEMVAMTGMQFWQETQLGRALAKKLPPMITRVIIDIPIHEAVKIYYSTVDTGPILDLKWDEIIEHVEIEEVQPQKHQKTTEGF